MFSKTIIDSDAFLDMPLSTQALYFHLSMRADDDGFINNPKKIMRMIGASQNEFELLLAKNFIIGFESGVIVIKHWKMHNYIQSDRYKPTVYVEEKSLLALKNNKSYTLNTECIQNEYDLEPQVRLGKVSLELGKDNIVSKDTCTTNVDMVINKWNELGLQKLVAINPNTNRSKLLNARIKEYGVEKILEAINNISKSSFLKGQNNKGWIITFDWLIKPNNFLKVLEGNYNNGGEANAGGKSNGNREVNPGTQTESDRVQEVIRSITANKPITEEKYEF